MIIESLLDLIFNVFNSLLSLVNIPDLPPLIENNLSTFSGYVGSGVGILSFYIDYNYIFGLVTFVFIVQGVILTYKVVLWVIHKIPFLNIR